MNAEYENTVITGLQRLMALRLNGHPPSDTITAVCRVWIEALEGCGEWHDERHIAALTKAFRLAEQQCVRWPSPAEVRRLKPPVVNVFKALPPPPKTDKEKAEIKAIINQIFNELSINQEEKQ